MVCPPPPYTPAHQLVAAPVTPKPKPEPLPPAPIKGKKRSYNLNG